MKKIKKWRYLSLKKSKLMVNTSILLVLMILLGTCQLVMAQSAPNGMNCEIELDDLVSMPHPDCEIIRPYRCVRVKFHDINNTNDLDDHLSDIFWRNMLDEVNEYYEDGNIRWVFDDNCIHRAKILGLGTDIFLTSKLYDLNNNWDPDSDIEFDVNAVNIYFIQGREYSGGGTSPNTTYNVPAGRCYIRLVDRMSADVIAHELGHALNLMHTFGRGKLLNNDDPINEDYWEYKTRGINKNCDGAGKGDELCDTGADPYGMDLEKDTKSDKGKWVEECMIKPEI